MRVHTDYLWFNTAKRQEFIRITDQVASIVSASGVQEGMVLVSAMHITARRFMRTIGKMVLHRRISRVARSWRPSAGYGITTRAKTTPTRT